MVLIQTYDFNGQTYTIKIGKKAEENWKIIEEALPNDIWFHLAGDRPSCHVVLQVTEDIQKVPIQVIKQCCVLCKANTNKFKSEKNVPVIYTKIKNVKLGEHVGQVYTVDTKEITI
jgi:predicted ribosome quality control (RQC) complex YloA/Tae2 family protein